MTAFCSGLLWLAPQLAFAHGAVPETMGVVFQSPDDALPLVTTSFGVLVAESGDDWLWVCEDLTGQTYGTLFEALPDGTWLFGATTGVWRTEDRCDWSTIPELDGQFVTSLKRDPEQDGRVWLTTATAEADNGLWRSDDSGASWSLVVGPTELGAGASVRGLALGRDGAIALTGWRDDLPYLWWLDADLEPTELPLTDVPEDASVTALDFDLDGGAVWLRYNGTATDQLVLATADGTTTPVLELSDNLLGFAVGPAEGQLEAGGRTAGLLRSADGGLNWTTADSPVEVGCIVDHGDQRYICANNWLDEGGIIVGEAGGDTWTPIVDFADVHGLADCPDGTETADECGPLWDGTRSFAGLDQADLTGGQDSDTGTEKEPGCGCTTGARGGTGMWTTMLVLGGLLWRRRRSGAMLAAALLAGCDGGGSDEPPYLAFLAPADGDTLCGDAIPIDLDVRGFELTTEVITDPDELPEGVGHAHIFLNGQYTYETGTPSFTLDEPVEDGAWQLKVELANANHAAVDPYVYDLIYITVDSTVCEGGGA